MRVPAAVPPYVRHRPAVPPPRPVGAAARRGGPPPPWLVVGTAATALALTLGLALVSLAGGSDDARAASIGSSSRESRVTAHRVDQSDPFAAAISGAGADGAQPSTHRGDGAQGGDQLVGTPAPWGVAAESEPAEQGSSLSPGESPRTDQDSRAASGNDPSARQVGGPPDTAGAVAEAQTPTHTPTEGDPPTPSDTPTITNTPEPTLTPTPAVELGLPVVPVIDAAMKDRLRAVHQLGLERGMRPDVFMKVGDSITVSGYFLTGFGCGSYDLGPYVDLAGTVAFFGAAELPTTGSVARCDAGNSFTRASRSAGRGWVASAVLTEARSPKLDCLPPNNTPLRCEISLIKPGTAIVMLGTNDLHNLVDLKWYEAALDGTVRELLEAGVVPVLSNIPHRRDREWAASRVGDYNAVVREVAARHQVPLINYWRALQGPEMVSGGMSPDGIHPNVYGNGTTFTERGLQHGYNQRNLSALQTLDKIRRIVLQDGPPE